ncbi:DUF4184 family protein [soil metagenome]
MPFTPSHAAAALPFLRTPLLPAALVAGSVAPDLPYFLPLPVLRGATHEWWSAPTVDLVIGASALLIWFAVLRAPLLALAPRWISARMLAAAPWGPRPFGRTAVGLVFASLFVGIVTHLVWDAFTHRGSLPQVLPALATQWGPLPVFSWLQHLSTITGLVILAVWARRWARRTPVDGTREPHMSARLRISSWVAVIAVFGIAGLAAWIPGIVAGLAPFDPGLVFLVGRVSVGAAGAAALVICLAWWAARRRLPNADLPVGDA